MFILILNKIQQTSRTFVITISLCDVMKNIFLPTISINFNPLTLPEVIKMYILPRVSIHYLADW